VPLVSCLGCVAIWQRLRGECFTGRFLVCMLERKREAVVLQSWGGRGRQIRGVCGGGGRGEGYPPDYWLNLSRSVQRRVCGVCPPPPPPPPRKLHHQDNSKPAYGCVCRPVFPGVFARCALPAQHGTARQRTAAAMLKAGVTRSHHGLEHGPLLSARLVLTPLAKHSCPYGYCKRDGIQCHSKHSLTSSSCTGGGVHSSPHCPCTTPQHDTAGDSSRHGIGGGDPNHHSLEHGPLLSTALCS